MKIQELCAQRDALCQTNAVAQALLAPIRKLPPETLGEIFILCIPVVHEHSFGSRPGGCNPAHIRQCLGAVCHRWKRTLDDTPQVWTSIVLDNASPFTEGLSAIQSLIQKSKACPLDIIINNYNARNYNIDTPSGHAHIRAVLQLLRGEVKRFRSFFCDTRRTDEIDLLGELFPAGESSDASILVAFGVQTTHHDGNMGDIMSHKLESIDLCGNLRPLRSFLASSFSLRRLRLTLQERSHDSTMYLSSLGHFPNLEILQLKHLSRIPTAGHLTSWSGPKISLPLLREISLKSFGVNDARNVLQSLHIPLLDTVHLNLRSNRREAVSVAWVFNVCLTPVVALLQRLTLENVKMAEDDKSWLLRLANIKFLKIGGAKSCLDETVVSTLTPPLFSPPDLWPCPKLEKLVFENITVPGVELVRLVNSRTQPDLGQRLPGYLSCFEVLYCFGLEQVHKEELLRMNRKSLQFSHNPDSWEEVAVWGDS